MATKLLAVKGLSTGRRADDALDGHYALVSQVSRRHLDLPHELAGDRVKGRYEEGAQRVRKLARLVEGRHAYIDIYKGKLVARPDRRVEAHEGPYARAYPRFVVVIEKVSVPPEPPPLLCCLALHDQIEGGDDGIYVFDFVDVSRIAVKVPVELFNDNKGHKPEITLTVLAALWKAP